MSSLNYTMQVFNAIFPDDERESWEQQQADGAQARYESMVVKEARAIVDGKIPLPPTKEHLRVVLEWLDGTRVQLHQAQPEAERGGDTPPF